MVGLSWPSIHRPEGIVIAGKKRFVLAAVSAVAVVTSLTPLDGDDFSENTLLGNPGKEAVNGIACDGIGAVVDTRLRCRP